MRPYIILKEADVDDLEAKVENYRERGYRPQGGVAIAQWERTGAIFYQAVYMPDMPTDAKNTREIDSLAADA